jgi:hypothetical protein
VTALKRAIAIGILLALSGCYISPYPPYGYGGGGVGYSHHRGGW